MIPPRRSAGPRSGRYPAYDRAMGSPGISRRRLLGLGAGAAAAASLAACTAGTTPVPAAPVSMRTGSFTSQFRPQTATGWSLAVPGTGNSPGSPGGAAASKPPVALFLHGTGADHRMIFDDLGAGDVLSQHVARGGTPFAIAAVDGGESWWHAAQQARTHSPWSSRNSYPC